MRMDSPSANSPANRSNTPLGVLGGSAPRIGLVYFDIAKKRLHFLNETARELRDEGVPFSKADLAKQPLEDLQGRTVSLKQLPLILAWREQQAVQGTYRLVRPGGTIELVCWSAAPHRDTKGTMIGVNGSVCRMAPQPDWKALAGLAHDLRTPLNALSLLASMMDRPDRPESELHENLADLRAAVARALAVGGELLDWCRWAAGKLQEMKSDWLVLEPLLNQLVREQMPAAQQKGIVLTFDTKAVADWEIHTNSVRLGRLLANLLVNAVRYTPSGSVAFTASWRDEPAGKNLVLGVVDTGTGISAEEQESIFQAFERGQAVKNDDSGGSGLGLAVVDRLVEELGLELEVYSEYGRGSAFHLLIPARLLRRTSGAITMTALDTHPDLDRSLDS
jgi:two-component sensor histidine kinase